MVLNKIYLVFLCFILACGENTIPDVSDSLNANNVLIIQDFTFLPEQIHLTPNSSLFVTNLDDVPYQLASQNIPDTFINSNLLAENLILPGQTVAIDVLVESGVVNFFDIFHHEIMPQPNGEIVLE